MWCKLQFQIYKVSFEAEFRVKMTCLLAKQMQGFYALNRTVIHSSL